MPSQSPDSKISFKSPIRAPSAVPVDDAVLPFEVDALDLRGRLTRLGPALDEILSYIDTRRVCAVAGRNKGQLTGATRDIEESGSRGNPEAAIEGFSLDLHIARNAVVISSVPDSS